MVASPPPPTPSVDSNVHLKIAAMCGVVLASMVGAVPPILQASGEGGDPPPHIYLMRAFTVMQPRTNKPTL